MSRSERIFQLVLDGLPAEFPPLRSLGAFSHNLPVQPSSFVGRTREAAEVKRLLSQRRLLTLSGPGGCGKTRLALQVAADTLEEYSGGVWFVNLAPLSDPEALPELVAATLGVSEEERRPLPATLIDRFREKPLLLLLDSCEHLVAATAEFAGQLLAACPELRILATSREVLNVHDELSWQVPSLTLPNAERQRTPRQLLESEAVALFVDRGAAARRGFVLDARNADTVAQICVRLEGIPLAIEIAAALLRMATAAEILQRLHRRFQLLTGGSRSTLSRHQTLRAAIDWSYELLDQPERTLFQRLSVFVGGWTLADAEAVCADEVLPVEQVLDVLGRLIDKSLVTVTDGRTATRYGMLDTLREYCLERLADSGDTETLRARHLRHFVALAESTDVALGARPEPDSLKRLGEQYDNLMAGLGAALRLDHDALLSLAASMASYWSTGERLLDGRRWLSEALRVRQAPTTRRAQAVAGLARILWQQGDYEAATALLREALGIYEQLGEELRAARCRNNLGVVAYNQGDFAGAIAHYEAGLSVFRRFEERRALGISLSNLGLWKTESGQLEDGRLNLEESLAIARALDDHLLLSQCLVQSGVNAVYRGDHEAARALFTEGLRLAHAIGDGITMAGGLEGLALLAAAGGDTPRAMRIEAAAAALRQRLQAPASPISESRYERFLAPAGASLLHAVKTEARRAGSRMTADEAVVYALDAGGR